MPRKQLAAVAGRNLLFGPPGTPPSNFTSRGGVTERADTITALGIAPLAEMLFEGGDGVDNVAFDEIRGNGVANDNGAGVIVHGGEQFSHHSVDSIQFNSVDANYVQVVTAIPTFFGFELWFRDNLTDGDHSAIFGNQPNFRIHTGRGTVTGFNWPSHRNDFNAALSWESEVDLSSDGLTHQLFEFRDTVGAINYIVCIDGMPVASATLDGGTQLNLNPSFNDRFDAAVSERFGGEMGSFAAFDNGANLTLRDCRELFETSALRRHDMLQAPRWFIVDSVNCVVPDPFLAKQVDLGDVLNNTGIRSGAIPRIDQITEIVRHTYFELEIIDQGDDPDATLLGVRRFAEAGNVGDDAENPADAIYLKAGKLHDGADIILPTGTGDAEQDATTLASPITGQIYRFAFDWNAQAPTKFWVGDDVGWKGRVGTVADPATDTDALGFLVTSFNWGAWLRNNDSLGNGKVRLRTKFYEMILPIPAGFDSWEPQTYTVEVAPNGVNRRQSVFDFYPVRQRSKWLFEGAGVEYLLDRSDKKTNGGATRDLTAGVGSAPTLAGPQLSFASVDSIRWPRVDNADALQPNVPNPDIHAFELWYRQPDFAQTQCCLFRANNGTRHGVGRGNGGSRFPAMVNNFNALTDWESEVDLYGDNKTHQLIEAHSTVTDYVIYVDGMPVASGTNTGWINNSRRFIINGEQSNGVDDLSRSGGDFGSLIEYKGGERLSQINVRRLYEASSFGIVGPVGVEDDTILDAQMTASSFAPTWEPFFGRLNDARAWIQVNPQDLGEWIQVDFLNVRTISEVKTQGNPLFSEFTQTYRLEFAGQDLIFGDYNSGQILPGNGNQNSIVTNVLIPFQARYIRLFPLTWQTSSSLRLEYIGAKPFDMLTNPRWFILDSVNCTVSAAPAKDLTCGDVTDDTGGRSGAIPRNGKVYFEVEIIAQGDNTASNLLGLRKLAEPSNVGFDPDTATDEYHTDGAGDVEDGQDNTLGITGTLGTAATGRIFQFAIDWASGDWWMGTDNTVYAGVGGVGNPSTGANPLDALDVDFNWAVVDRVNGVNGNGVVRLITADVDLNFAKPTSYVAWEDAI